MWLFCVLCYYKRDQERLRLSQVASLSLTRVSAAGPCLLLLCALIVDVHFILTCCVLVGTSVRETPA
jgi:hypothetical protein